MIEKTYQKIKDNIHLLEVDFENGEIKNRKIRLSKKGYFVFSLIRRDTFLHNVIAFMKYGEKSIGLDINHIDGNKLNNRPENLELCTPSENNIHALENGLRKIHGSYNNKSKLTEKDILIIRKMLENGEPQKNIAKCFNVSQSQISNIKINKTWKHVKGEV